MSNVRIGTSGWSYPTGKGTWNGVFYPPPRRRPKGFDDLSFYAEHFDTVEVNSTFYGQPRAEVTRGWAGRTPAGFEFSVKLYQKFTHPRMFRERVVRGLPEEARDAAEAIDSLARPNAADLDEFRRGIDPLASAGRLGALLAQFPPSFKDDPRSREYLEQLLRAFAGFPVAVELRHKSWSDRIGETLAQLNAHGAAWVQIDEPKFQFSIRQNSLPNVTGFYYMRLHGRNAAKWWRHDKSEDRYDYLYSADELKPFTETADAARRLVRKVYLYANNHFSAKSVANAAMIKHQLGEPVEGDYPPEFVERYSELEGVIRVRPSAESDLLARAAPAPRRRR
ncbi:MAG TPA: DUF72 domain-containing protein [Vicinamibacterales bacterium]|nr:DUF72 domain-containing protein [Vicinamibacterales bacterium]